MPSAARSMAGLDKFSDIAPIQLWVDDTGLDPGHVQQIVNHAMEASQRLLDLPQGCLGPFVIADLLCQRIDTRMHRRQRGFQLV